MLSDLQIEFLSHGCSLCKQKFQSGQFCSAVYLFGDLRYANLVNLEVGIAGQGIRNFWKHVDCSDPLLSKLLMRPTIENCARCNKHFRTADLVQPVFRVVDACAQNPEDSEDRGILLGDRVYFVHADCSQSNLIVHV